jgi:hypothetical protein
MFRRIDPVINVPWSIFHSRSNDKNRWFGGVKFQGPQTLDEMFRKEKKKKRFGYLVHVFSSSTVTTVVWSKVFFYQRGVYKCTVL